MLKLANKFSKVAEYKINIQKSVLSLCITSELLEREIKGTIPFTIAAKRIKCLGINLPKETKPVMEVKSNAVKDNIA